MCMMFAKDRRISRYYKGGVMCLSLIVDLMPPTYAFLLRNISALWSLITLQIEVAAIREITMARIFSMLYVLDCQEGTVTYLR